MGPVHVAIAILLLSAASLLAAPAEDDQLSQRAWAVISQRCMACHGGGPKIRSGLDLRSRATALKGGERGPAIVPGDATKSLIYTAVTRSDEDLAMPPKEKDALSADEQRLIHDWIAAGAAWPARSSTTQVATTRPWGADQADGVTVATSGGITPEWDARKYKLEDLWAYRPIQRRTPPLATTNPIDAFIQKKLIDKGISRLAPPAERLALIRRVSFDLTGLPPTPQDVQKFLADESADAYERLVKRLLASAQYAEQMARHWLDVVRYADSAGFSNDFERPSAWRYRDYVIRSFNRDKPYDRFVIEQIAGDELGSGSPENQIAVGYLRMGPWEHTEMTVAAVTRQQYLDDITQNVGVTFLGQPLRCASCHDHKFDPVPTRDYYRIQAVFSSAQFAEKPAQFLDGENTKQDEKTRIAIEQRAREAKETLAQLAKKNAAAVAAEIKDRGVASYEDIPQQGRPNKGELGLSKEEISLRKVTRKRLDYLEREQERYAPLVYTVYSGTPNGYSSTRSEAKKPKKDLATSPATVPAVPIVHILANGALDAAGDAVTPGVLSAVAGSNDSLEPNSWNSIPNTMSGRRLALANWIASPSNTLAARVVVNRVWQQHFGTGLVSTPNNFGKMGGKPTHPELLDFLAVWFIEHGWSLKQLHELIVTSATYQQAGEHPDAEKIAQVDPKNQLLAFFPPRRLAAEEIRDAMLAASGELNPEMGGPGVFPQINWEVALQPRHVMGSVAPPYQPSRTPAERNRRTIYAFRYRTLSDPLLEVFNRPGSETSCERRDQTTITPQAFALFNSEYARDRAVAMAVSLREKAQSIDDQVTLAFQRVYGRSPTSDELKKCAAHVQAMLKHHQEHSPQEVALPSKVTRSMVEEMTGEELQWDEELDRMRDFVPDAMPWTVNAQTRALAEFCLVLLNSNEFLYVR